MAASNMSEKPPKIRDRTNALISVVAPAFNEEENLIALYERCKKIVEDGGSAFEMVIAENGSIDGSLKVLRDLHAKDPRVNYVSLSRNFGGQGGLLAGLEHCHGDAVVTMDADLQHPPEKIPDLLEKWETGFDVVTSRRLSNPDTGLFRQLLNNLFYKFMDSASGIPLSERQSDFRLMDRSALDALLSLPEKNKYFRCLSYWVGFSQAYIEYEAAPRLKGVTKFRPLDLLKFAAEGITAFSVLPLHIFAVIGTVISVGSLFYGLIILLDWMFSKDFNAPPGFATLSIGIYFLGGVQLIGIGVLGEYLGRVYDEARGRPGYIVREATGSKHAFMSPTLPKAGDN
jgi:polyisoprenyl-phosphate glycosyltransferase